MVLEVVLIRDSITSRVGWEWLPILLFLMKQGCCLLPFASTCNVALDAVQEIRKCFVSMQ